MAGERDEFRDQSSNTASQQGESKARPRDAVSDPVMEQLAQLRTELYELRAKVVQLELEKTELQKNKEVPDEKFTASFLRTLLNKQNASEEERHVNDAQRLSENKELRGDVKVKYNTMKQESANSDYYRKSEGHDTSGFGPAKTADSDQDDSAMVFTEYRSAQDTRTKVVVKIYSADLRDLIRKVMHPLLEHENSKLWMDLPVTVRSNDVLVIHSLATLRDAAMQDSKHGGSEKARKELECYLKHIEGYEAETIQARDLARKEGVVEYYNLWTLFPPGAEVVATPFLNNHQIFVVRRHGPSSKGDGFAVSCWAYDWDGQKLARNSYEFVVPKYTGFKKVDELPCYPLNFHKIGNGGHQKLRERLAGRGRKFQQYCIPASNDSSPRLLLCDNFDVTLPQKNLAWSLFNTDSGKGSVTFKTSGQGEAAVIIDPLLYQRYAPGSGEYSLRLGDMVPETRKTCECRLCNMEGQRSAWNNRFTTRGVSRESSPAIDPELEAMFYSQLPPRLLGFIIDRKAWGQMHVDHIKEEQAENKDRSSWVGLCLDDAHKENIKSIVQNHLQNRTKDYAKIQDLILGKGEGLLLLLHGIPGLGKTMTAESLAKSMGRRLLRIDASDLDQNDPSQVSSVLKSFFHWAHSWGCLLLVDEADVFLQLRRPGSLVQNALVAVLLREIEYFQGILILTTNRVIQIDNAIQSRIHYAVRFQALKSDSFQKVCKTFMDQLTDENCRPGEKDKIEDYLKESSRDLVRKRFTGRDIRNIFTTAQLMDYPWLSLRNLKEILGRTGDFREDLKTVSTQRESENAVVFRDEE